MPDTQTEILSTEEFAIQLSEADPESWPNMVLARDAAIRKEEREACAAICQSHGDWCMKEAHHGGNWDYLQKRSQAVLYMAEKIRARPPGAVGSSTTPAYEGPRTGGTGSPGVRDE